MKKRECIAAILLGTFIFTSCATVSPVNFIESPHYTGPLSPVQTRLLTGARSLLGAKKIKVNGRSFSMDCTGVVLGIYWSADIDLQRDFNKHSGNGVTRIYKDLEDRKLLYTTNFPSPGDIIFWDDTYDRNGDGKWNDPFTHMGMVVDVNPNGQIDYIHLNYRKGIVIERMNLEKRNIHQEGGLIVNSPMRMKGQTTSTLWLSSHLLKIFGMGYSTGFE
jgi:surface antigen